MSRIRMSNQDLYVGSANATPPGKYIPQLNVFYDEKTNIYYNQNGRIVTISKEDVMDDTKHESKKSHFTLEMVLQILALVLAAAAQYNVLENKISESETQLAVFKAVTDERFNNVPQMYKDMDNLRIKQEELMREIDELKFRTSKK
jgi:hypothetical protein